MPKLNQIIAIQAGKKTQAKEALTQAYHAIQKSDLLSGLARSYKAKDEDGDVLPAENKLLQVKTGDIVSAVRKELVGLLDIVATQDQANTLAAADIVVDGKVLLPKVPVTYLLFLEHQVVDLTTFVSKLPTLDPGERWSYDEAQDCYVSEVYQTTRSKKVMKNHVKAAATDKHPAQVDVYSEDVIVGTWSTTKFSGAIPVKERNELLARIKVLSDAIKIARESANSIDVSAVTVGDPLLGYVFDGDVG